MVYLNYFLSLTDIEDEVIMVAQRKDEGKLISSPFMQIDCTSH